MPFWSIEPQDAHTMVFLKTQLEEEKEEEDEWEGGGEGCNGCGRGVLPQ